MNEIKKTILLHYLLILSEREKNYAKIK